MVCEVTESQAVFRKSLAPLVCLSQRNTLTLVMPFKTKMHATCPFVSPGTFSQTLYCINPEVSPIGCQIGHELNLNKTKCLVLPLNPPCSVPPIPNMAHSSFSVVQSHDLGAIFNSSFSLSYNTCHRQENLATTLQIHQESLKVIAMRMKRGEGKGHLR